MSATNLLLLSAVITVGGVWAQKKEFKGTVVIGTAFAIIFVAVISALNEDLGSMFAWLVLLAVGYQYIPPILKGLHL